MNATLSRTLFDFAMMFSGYEIEGGHVGPNEARAFVEAFRTMGRAAAQLEIDAASPDAPVDLREAFGPDGDSLDAGVIDEDIRRAWAEFAIAEAVKASEGRVVRFSDRRSTS